MGLPIQRPNLLRICIQKALVMERFFLKVIGKCEVMYLFRGPKQMKVTYVQVSFQMFQLSMFRH